MSRRERRLLDFDPLTGISCVVEFDVDGSMHLDHYDAYNQTAVVADHNQRLRNDDDYTKNGIKNDYWHYAKIPTIWIYKWKQELGVDVFNRDHRKKVMQLLNTDYQWMKTTNKTHDR